MKITLVVGYLALGGTERQVAHLANGLVARGHRVDVLLLRYTQAADYPIDSQVRVTPLNITAAGHRLSGMRRIRQAFQESDVVYSLLDLSNLICALCKPRRGATLVWGFRASNTAAGWMGASVLRALRLLQRKASLVITNAEAVERYYRSRGLSAITYQVVANGVEPATAAGVSATARAALLARLGIPTQALVALVLARAAPEKRQALALDLLPKIPELHVVYCGSGCETLPEQWATDSSLRVDASLLGRCRFVPHQGSVGPLLTGSDLLLCLSDNEGFPNAVTEAMALGLPVVSTAAGAIPQLLRADAKPDERCGWVVRCGDAAALVDAIAEFRSNPGMAEQRCSNARRRVRQDFTVDKMVEGTLRCLQQVAEQAD